MSRRPGRLRRASRPPAGALSDVAIIAGIAGRFAGGASCTRERIARTCGFDPVSEDVLIALGGTLETHVWMTRAQRPRP